MEHWPEGVGREIHAALDSTNAEALRRARTGPGPLWILAHAQSAGHGRRGRPWTTGRGDFAASLLMTPAGGPAEAALRSFAAALALRDACLAVGTPPGRLAFKWPNDLLLDGRKLAGILLETAGPPLRLAIGFGVNLAVRPDPAGLEPGALAPAALAEAGVRIRPETLLAPLAMAFARWEGELATRGFAPLRAAWLAGAIGLGAPVTARLPGRQIEGRFETLDAAGAAVLATAAGRAVLPAAELHFGPGEARDAAGH
jgi:BirA family transcriptional regulator, biotin operon repressor / biotin---[acetyl-CoA-carboxylase] ligase